MEEVESLKSYNSSVVDEQLDREIYVEPCDIMINQIHRKIKILNDLKLFHKGSCYPKIYKKVYLKYIIGTKTYEISHISTTSLNIFGYLYEHRIHRYHEITDYDVCIYVH